MKGKYISLLMMCLILSAGSSSIIQVSRSVDDISSEDDVVEWGPDDSNNNYTHLKNTTQVLIHEPGRGEKVKGEIQITGDVIGVNITRVDLFIDGEKFKSLTLENDSIPTKLIRKNSTIFAWYWETTWNTENMDEGSHRIEAEIHTENKTVDDEIKVSVDNKETQGFFGLFTGDSGHLVAYLVIFVAVAISLGTTVYYSILNPN